MTTFAVSDLHLGRGGPRDIFAYRNRMPQFHRFLDSVEQIGGKLYILGDLFDFWVDNLSEVIWAHLPLLDRLASMEARFIVGNHDVDLIRFCGTDFLKHSFFHQMTRAFTEAYGDKIIRFAHGHEGDPYCVNEAPGSGRLSAIIPAMLEDQGGSPVFRFSGKYIAPTVCGAMEAVAGMWDWLCGRGSRIKSMHRGCREYLLRAGGEILVCGHTHAPGRIGKWLYNTGSWVTDTPSYAIIKDDGSVKVYNWPDGWSGSLTAWPNTTQLPI